MTNLQQFKEESKERFEKEFTTMLGYIEAATGESERKHLLDALSSELERLVEVAREETRVEGMASTKFDAPEDGWGKRRFNQALSEVESKWQEFIN